uniref:VTT domain-containing protein n=1 Tax=Arion vulgaris TaxID=1028688 RepID=A0A0B6ZRU6_9EUPU
MTKLDVLPVSYSKIEAVNLPVTTDSCCIRELELGDNWDTRIQHYFQYEQQTLLLSNQDNTDFVKSGPEKDAKKVKGENIGTCRRVMQAIITGTSDSNDWCCRVTLVSAAVSLILLFFLVFGHRYIYSVLLWMEHTDPKISVLVLAALFIIICFPVAWGLSILMVTAGYLYGLMYGQLVVTVSLTIGLAMSTPIMRAMCSDYLWSLFYSRKTEVIMNVLSGPQGMRVIALTRLTPIPFGLQNALFSLSSISLTRYLISSIVGLIPMTLLNCYMGTTLRNIQDLVSDGVNSIGGYLIFGGQILITVILLWFMVRKAKVELKKAMIETDTLPTALSNGDSPEVVLVDL